MGAPPAKQLKMQQCAKTAACVSQATVDHLVLDFIVEGLLPFSTVELPAFKRLVTGLQPGKSVPCRATVKTRMQSRVATLQSVECVATMTDCWSARNRSYIGATVHWIDLATMDRRSAALACRRLRGSHTFDVLAGALEDVHRQYGIIRKVAVTTTMVPILSRHFPFFDGGRAVTTTTAAATPTTTTMRPSSPGRGRRQRVPSAAASPVCLPHAAAGRHRRCRLDRVRRCIQAHLEGSFRQVPGPLE